MKKQFQSLVSPNHDESKIDEALRSFYLEIEKGVGQKLEDMALPLVFIKSGGVEGVFKSKYGRVDGPVYLLTTDYFNSLPAAIEILAFLRQKKIEAEIIHGGIGTVTEKLRELKEKYEC